MNRNKIIMIACIIVMFFASIGTRQSRSYANNDPAKPNSAGLMPCGVTLAVVGNFIVNACSTFNLYGALYFAPAASAGAAGYVATVSGVGSTVILGYIYLDYVSGTQKYADISALASALAVTMANVAAPYAESKRHPESATVIKDQVSSSSQTGTIQQKGKGGNGSIEIWAGVKITGKDEAGQNTGVVTIGVFKEVCWFATYTAWQTQVVETYNPPTGFKRIFGGWYYNPMQCGPTCAWEISNLIGKTERIPGGAMPTAQARVKFAEYRAQNGMDTKITQFNYSETICPAN